MAIDYDALLTVDQKKAIVENRLQQIVTEAYQTELNKKIQLPNIDEKNVADYDATLSLLESAVAVHLEELAKLNAE